MSWIPNANRNDVLHWSGMAGVNLQFSNHIPDEVTTSTTGDASAESDSEGLILNCVNDGDTAQMRARKDPQALQHPYYMQFIFSTDTQTEYDERIGFCTPGPTEDGGNYAEGVYYDIRNQELISANENEIKDSAEMPVETEHIAII